MIINEVKNPYVKKNIIDEKKLLNLMKSSKLTIDPKDYQMFIDDLNDIISFCESVRTDFENTEENPEQNQNNYSFLDSLCVSDIMNVYKEDSFELSSEEHNVFKDSDRLSSGYVSVRRCNL